MIQAKENCGINLENWSKRRIHVVVTYDCNMNCSFCINFRLGQKKKEYINVQDVSLFLEYMKYIEKIEDAIVVLLGGEPTLLGINNLKQISTFAHNLGYKVETYTNGTLGKELLELDGYIDYITISNYGKGILPFEDMEYLTEFKYSTITISRLITKQNFGSFEEFDSFVDEANKLPFNYDFSTIQKATENFEFYHPDWIEDKLLPLCVMLNVEGRIDAVSYKGRLIKLPYKLRDVKESISGFKIFPNGNVSASWKNDDPDIDYKGELERRFNR